jgi:ACT domain-containing protein
MPDPFTIEKTGGQAVRHFSIFLDNKVGALLEVVKLLGDNAIVVLALSIQDSAESSICRFIVSDPDHVEELFEENDIPHSVSEVVVTELKEGAADLAPVLAALLKAEVNVLFSYPLLIRPRGRALLALHVDDNECASAVLRGDGFPILTQDDLSR